MTEKTNTNLNCIYAKAKKESQAATILQQQQLLK